MGGRRMQSRRCSAAGWIRAERALYLVGAGLALGESGLEGAREGGTLPACSHQSLHLAHGLAVLGLDLRGGGGELRCVMQPLGARALRKAMVSPCDCGMGVIGGPQSTRIKLQDPGDQRSRRPGPIA